MAALRAWVSGLWCILRAPLVVAGIYLATLALTVPLGVVLHAGLPAPADVSLGDAEPAPDLDWLEEVTVHATGLRATLTPSVIGVAAPLTNLGAVLDGRLPAPATMAVSAVYFVVWAAMWGGVIRRFAHDRALGPRGFTAASARSWWRLLRLGAIGLAGYLILFLTVHALLLGPVYEWAAAGAIERTAFVWRVGFAVVFVGVLAWFSQVLDYARIAAVLSERAGVMMALKNGASFVGRQPMSVMLLWMINGVLFGGLLTAYGAVEFVPGGSVPRLSRVIVIGQAYIAARLALRLLLAASQVRLYQRATAAATAPTNS